MAIISPILRIRRAFRSMGVDAEQADEATDAVNEHSYSRRESDDSNARYLERMDRIAAELRTQVLLAIFIATGLIIGAISIAVAIMIWQT